MKAYVFLHNDYADWEIGNLLPELNRKGNDIHVFGLTSNEITSGGGLKVRPEYGIERVSAGKLSSSDRAAHLL